MSMIDTKLDLLKIRLRILDNAVFDLENSPTAVEAACEDVRVAAERSFELTCRLINELMFDVTDDIALIAGDEDREVLKSRVDRLRSYNIGIYASLQDLVDKTCESVVVLGHSLRLHQEAFDESASAWRASDADPTYDEDSISLTDDSESRSESDSGSDDGNSTAKHQHEEEVDRIVEQTKPLLDELCHQDRTLTFDVVIRLKAQTGGSLTSDTGLQRVRSQYATDDGVDRIVSRARRMLNELCNDDSEVLCDALGKMSIDAAGDPRDLNMTGSSCQEHRDPGNDSCPCGNDMEKNVDITHEE